MEGTSHIKINKNQARCKNCFSDNCFNVDFSRNDVICTVCGAVQSNIMAEQMITQRYIGAMLSDGSQPFEFSDCIRLHAPVGDKTIRKLAQHYGLLLDASEPEIDRCCSLFDKNPAIRVYKPISATVASVLVLLKRERGHMADLSLRSVESLSGMRLGERIIHVANDLNMDTIKDPSDMIPMVISRLGLPQRYNKFLKSIYLRKFTQMQTGDYSRRPTRATIFAAVVYKFFRANMQKSSFKDKVTIDFIAEITQTTVTNIKRLLEENI